MAMLRRPATHSKNPLQLVLNRERVGDVYNSLTRKLTLFSKVGDGHSKAQNGEGSINLNVIAGALLSL